MKHLKSYVKSILPAVLILLAFTGSTLASSAWPKVISTPEADITIYQPTPESLSGTLLSGRAAISIKLKDEKRPIFGAIWVTSELDVDRDTRIAVLKNIKVPQVKFSDDLDSTGSYRLSRLIEEEAPKWKLELSMDDLITTLESADVKAGGKFRTDPPEIIISDKPAVLVIIDGNPILKDLEGYDFQRIENTPFFIVFNPKDKEYYMYGDKVWFTASDLMGTWTTVKRPSSSLKKLQDDVAKATAESQDNRQEEVKKEPETVPAVIVRTTPAELVVINGEAEFTPIPQTNLLYVKNSDNNVFMDIGSQKYFILVSGRWYSSPALKGPWTYTDADKLPEDFAKIPEGTDKDEVLASVAGTNAAREAILDTQIPQTAEVDRKTTTVKVEYDGEPKFEAVDGTSMLYAVNSPQTVLKVSANYYCIDNGIWFEASSADGPWKVADKRPPEVDNIEPSSSVYNIKYVYIYDSTPDVVYVGYTPGYYGTYVYGPTVIYGTGYPYVPWFGSFYYPRPATYGFSMHYNPFSGWSMGFRISFGPVHFSFGSGRFFRGYWGPPLYRPPYHYHRPGGWYGSRPGHGGYYPSKPGRPTGGTRPVTGRPGRPSTGSGDRVNPSIYDNNRAGVRPAASNRRPAAAGDRVAVTRPQAGNVYTDKSGNVYQKNNKGGWEQRQNNSWQSTDKVAARPSATTRPSSGTRPSTGASNATRPSTGAGAATRPSAGSSAATRPSQTSSFNRSELDRQALNRDRGAVRTSNYSNYSRSGSVSGTARGGLAGGGARRK